MSSRCPHTLDTEQCESLLSALTEHMTTDKKKRKAVRNHCMALLMLEAGLRVGELVSLRFSDLYFNSVPVRSILIKPEMTKNKVEHTIPVSDRLALSLRSFFTKWYLCDVNLPGSFAFFSTTEDKPLTTRQVERIICKAGWTALNRPIHPHVLRHTFASRLMRVTNSSTVQQMLGHKYLSSTQIYCHPNEDDKRQAIQSASVPAVHSPNQEPQRPERTGSQEVQRPEPVPASGFGALPGSHGW